MPAGLNDEFLRTEGARNCTSGWKKERAGTVTRRRLWPYSCAGGNDARPKGGSVGEVAGSHMSGHHSLAW